jgi:tetratricopeptide (TPR) repeat protein
VFLLLLAGLLLAQTTTFDELRQLAASGKLAKAEELLQTANVAPAEVAHLQGLIAFHRHDFKRAASELVKAIEAAPERSAYRQEAIGLLGRSLYLDGKTAEALPWLEKAHKAGDRSPELLRVLGNSAVEQRDRERARTAFAELFGIPSDSAAAHVISGLMFMRQRFEHMAEQEFQAAVRLDPEVREAHFHLGEIAIFRGETERAIAELTEEIARNPTHSMSYYRLGDAYLRLDKANEARLALQRSIWLNPYFSSPFILLGKLHLQQGELTDAEEVLRHAIGMDANNSMAYYLLGQTLARAGRTAEGKAMLEKATQLRSR